MASAASTRTALAWPTVVMERDPWIVQRGRQRRALRGTVKRAL